MQITFVLPAPIRIPMGGPKVVYQHATRFAALGHRVTVVMPERTQPGLQGWARHAAVQIRDRLHRVSTAPYYRAEGVETRVTPTLAPTYLPDADVVIATGVQTASWVRALPATKGKKVYFIQHMESFIDPCAVETWHFSMARVPCATWLADEIKRNGLDVLGIVPNAVDPREFYQTEPVERRALRVAALYHRHPIKGPDVLIEALAHLKRSLPVVKADVFAARRPSHVLPDYVRVHVRPSVAALRALYNRTAVLLHPSRSEGWGLVPMEAAACGAAVVSSANPAIEGFLVAGESVRLAPIGDGVALAEAALALLREPEARARQARCAQRHVARFDLDAHARHYLDLLQTLVKRGPE